MRDSIWSRTLPSASRDALLASDELPATADIVVVGAGIVGLCAALALQRRGVPRIVVIDRSGIGAESTGASAGGLWSGHECLSMPRPAMAREAADLHEALRAEFPCDFVGSGLLVLLDPGSEPAGRRRVERTRKAGFHAELLSETELATCEPALRHPGGALRFAGDGSLHPLKLAAAMAAGLRRRGVRFCLNHEVVGLDPGGPEVFADGGRISAGSVVVAAGAWTPLLTGLLGWTPPIRPIRGTLVATEAQSPGTLRSVVIGQRFYYWQLGCGPLAGGGSEEDVGYCQAVDRAVVADIRREWTRILPGLAGLPFTTDWSGLRPHCEDLRPIIGRVPGTGGIFVSAGHFRKGILLAPLSAEILVSEMLNDAPHPHSRAFRPGRFPPVSPDA